MRIGAGVLYVAITGTAFALRNVEWTVAYSRPITVAVVQGAVSELEFDFGAYAAEHFERMEATAAAPAFVRACA